AWGLGLLAHFIRQPLILAYLIAGFFIGPFGMGWVKSQESIQIISELGLIFMLFMIGLEIDLKKIIRAGRVVALVVTARALSRYVLPPLFHQIARRPELVLLGALAWCFLIGEIAEL